MPTDQPSTSSVTADIVQDADGGAALSVEGVTIATLESLKKNPVTVLRFYIAVGPGKGAGTFRVQGLQRSVILKAAAFPDWQAELPPGALATIEPDFSLKMITLAADPTNAAPIRLAFSDNGEATVAPGGAASFDLFEDHSYTLTAAQGVTAKNAEGQILPLDRDHPPLSGGPLIDTNIVKGQSGMLRRLPTRAAAISGSIGGTLQIQVAETLISLNPGEQEDVSLSHGARVKFHYDAQRKAFGWHVPKGDFRFTVEGFSGWSTIGLTRDVAEMLWDAEAQVLDVKNQNPTGQLLVLLDPRSFASVSPFATFQFASFGRGLSSIAAAGGSVNLLNSVNDEVIPIEQNNLLLRHGIPAPDPGTLTKTLDLRLDWQIGAPLRIASKSGQETLKPQSEKTLEQENLRAQIDYTESKVINIESRSGTLKLSLPQLNGLVVELEQGEMISLLMDPTTERFTIRSFPANSGSPKMNRDDFFDPVELPAGNEINFDRTPEGHWLASQGGQPLSSQVAGANNRSQSTIFFKEEELLDASRIIQPPVSVFK